MQPDIHHLQPVFGAQILAVGAHAPTIDDGDIAGAYDLNGFATLNDKCCVLVNPNTKKILPVGQHRQQTPQAQALVEMLVNNCVG